MGDFTAVRQHVYSAGAIIVAGNHNDNENEIYQEHNNAFHATTGHGHTGATGDGKKLDSTGLDLTATYAWSGAHTHTANLNLYSGADLKVYSDAGTTQVLDIDGATGAISMTRTSGNAYIELKSAGAGLYSGRLEMYSARGTIAAPTISQNSDLFGQFYTYGYDGSTYRETSAILAIANGAPAAGNVPTDLAFKVNTGSTTTTEKMRLTKSGYLGVGTDTAECHLHVKSGSGGGATINGNTMIKLENNSDTYLEIETPNTNIAGILFSDNVGSAASIKYSHSTNRMSFNAITSYEWQVNGSGRLNLTNTAFTLDSNVDLIVGATKRVYYDSGGNTYDTESSPDTKDSYIGGTLQLRMSSGANDFRAGHIYLAASNSLFFDGGVDTSLRQISDNILAMRLGGTDYLNFAATGTYVYSTGSASLSINNTTNAVLGTSSGLWAYLRDSGNTDRSAGLIGWYADATWTSTASTRDGHCRIYAAVNGVSTEGLRINSDTTGGLSTDAGTNFWKLKGYTAGAPAATGYVSIDINGTTYKLLAST